jgi:DNA-binding response OmpR family regulator
MDPMLGEWNLFPKGQAMTQNIMIVDDSPEILNLYGIMLERQGYHVFRVPDGASALQILEGAIPDLFILDVMMPEINGIELCRRIRALPQHKQTPVIFLSAYSDTETVENVFAAGANDFVRKPIEMQDLEAKIKRLLGSTKAQP